MINKVTTRTEGKKKFLVVEMEMQAPTASQSGKTLIVASTSGPSVTEVEVDGKRVTFSANAYIKA